MYLQTTVQYSRYIVPRRRPLFKLVRATETSWHCMYIIHIYIYRYIVHHQYYKLWMFICASSIAYDSDRN